MARVRRFHVMAILQAARARALGLDSEEAKSWGLNRALFYAAVKRGWENAKAIGAKKPVLKELEKSREHHDPVSIIKSASRRDLDIQSRFFNNIYKPRRDMLAARWSRGKPIDRPNQKAAA